MAELRQAGLAEEQVAALLEIYKEMREAEEGDGGKKSAAQNQETPAEAAGDAACTSQQAGMAGQKVGGLALGVISRLLTVLQLMYQVWLLSPPPPPPPAVRAPPPGQAYLSSNLPSTQRGFLLS